MEIFILVTLLVISMATILIFGYISAKKDTNNKKKEYTYTVIKQAKKFKKPK